MDNFPNTKVKKIPIKAFDAKRVFDKEAINKALKVKADSPLIPVEHSPIAYYEKLDVDDLQESDLIKLNSDPSQVDRDEKEPEIDEKEPEVKVQNIQINDDDDQNKDLEPDIKDVRLDPIWNNQNPNISLKKLSLNDYDMLKDFIEKNGAQLECLNLKGHEIDNDQFEYLIKFCPKLRHLFIRSPSIEDHALAHLKGIPMTSINFRACRKLTDQAIEHLKGMSLTSVNFIGCGNFTDQAIEHLKGMPLTSVTFSFCNKLTDQALRHLKEIPLLTSIHFSCPELTDQALKSLKEIPLLTSVQFSSQNKLTDRALENLKGIPLTKVYLRKCRNLTYQALVDLVDEFAKKRIELKVFSL